LSSSSGESSTIGAGAEERKPQVRIAPFFGTEPQLRALIEPYGKILRLALLYEEAFVTFEQDEGARALIFDAERNRIDLGRCTDPNSQAYGEVTRVAETVTFRTKAPRFIKSELAPAQQDLLAGPGAAPLPLEHQVTVYPITENTTAEQVLSVLSSFGNVLLPVQVNLETHEAHAT
jgi:hypothetical protein